MLAILCNLIDTMKFNLPNLSLRIIGSRENLNVSGIDSYLTTEMETEAKPF